MNLPSNLNEAFDILKKELSPTEQIEIISMSKKEICRMHHSLGRWIRNNWGLWADGPLKKYFNNIGIHHADDMSGIILESFWHHLRDEPLEIEEQVKYYQDFWENRKQ